MRHAFRFVFADMLGCASFRDAICVRMLRAVELTPAEVHRRMTEEDMVLIDVRENHEWDAGHVPGSRHIELSLISTEASTIPADRPVAFICLSGARSGMVASALRRAGYDAYNVAGGFADWFALGLPSEPEGAFVAWH